MLSPALHAALYPAKVNAPARRKPPRALARALRRQAAEKLKPPAMAEKRYVEALTRGIRTMHARAMAYLRPRLHLVARADMARADAATPIAGDFAQYSAALIKQLADSVHAPFEAMAIAVSKRNYQALAALGIDVRSGGLAATIDQLRDWNVSLITKAGQAYVADVQNVLDDPASWGLRVEELAAKLVERGNVSESRAELVARDQTLKMNGALSRSRQQSAGITEYIWSTSRDERVRPTHVANEGQRFSYTAPPPETGNPSDDIQCRCVAIPYVPELDDPAAEVP